MHIRDREMHYVHMHACTSLHSLPLLCISMVGSRLTGTQQRALSFLISNVNNDKNNNNNPITLEANHIKMSIPDSSFSPS